MNQNFDEKEDNVVKLFKHVDEPHLLNAEQSINQAKQLRIDFCKEIVDMSLDVIIPFIQHQGALVDPKKTNTYDILMIEQAIESAVYRYYGIEHKMHDLTDELFVIEGDESDD